ncbi:MAG: hypothetical protein WCO99_10815 [Planctomycetota bacterium]
MLTFLLLHWITWTALVSAAVFNFGENLWALVSPPPTLKISSATTSIVEPLAPDGMPDYLRASRGGSRWRKMLPPPFGS